METPQSTPPAASTPEEPILILGKEDNFFFALETVEKAVDYTNRYLRGATDSDIPQQGRLPLDELDFFDSLGHRLAPVRDTQGTLVDLVFTHQVEIRNRIRKMFAIASSLHNADLIADEPPPTPGEELTFGEFLPRIVIATFDDQPDCPWWKIWTGTCP